MALSQAPFQVGSDVPADRERWVIRGGPGHPALPLAGINRSALGKEPFYRKIHPLGVRLALPPCCLFVK